MAARPLPQAGSAHQPWWDRIGFTTLLAFAVWAPLPLGSNRPWAVGLMASGLWAALLTCWVGNLSAGHLGYCRRLVRAALPLALLGAFALLLVGQLWAPALAASYLHTLDPFQTRIYLLTSLAFFAAFVLVQLCVNTPARATLLLATVVGAGVLQAVIAVALFSTGASYQFMFVDFEQGGRATGTFPNADHLAGYLQLCLAAGLGLLLAQFGGARVAQHTWQARIANALAFLLSGKMLLRLMLVVMVVALVMTHSRMGNGAFFFALLLMGGFVAAVSQRLRRPALLLVLSMAVVDIFIIGQWVGLARVVERLQGTAQATVAAGGAPDVSSVIAAANTEESVQDRLQVPRLSLPLVWQQPWFGHGGGTYFLSLPAIKPAGFPYLWDHAHNDYVELAVDTGLAGLGLMLLLGVATAWRAACMLRDAEPRLKRGVGVAALMALSCLGIHGMVDFNLQIPANSLTLILLLALVWATFDDTAAPASLPRRR